MASFKVLSHATRTTARGGHLFATNIAIGRLFALPGEIRPCQSPACCKTETGSGMRALVQDI